MKQLPPEPQSRGFVITNPLTGRPFTHTPDGTPLEGCVFSSREELEAFAHRHWPDAVFLVSQSR